VIAVFLLGSIQAAGLQRHHHHKRELAAVNAELNTSSHLESLAMGVDAVDDKI
jgi:hypothetical protein